MACGPNLVPGRCEVPPSNGAPRNTTSYPSSASSSTRGTPRNVTSGPYIPRRMGSSSPAMAAPFGKPDLALAPYRGESQVRSVLSDPQPERGPARSPAPADNPDLAGASPASRAATS